MSDRKIPTREEVIKQMDVLGAFDWADGFKVNESHHGKASITVLGQSDDGTPFGFEVRISAVEEQ